jgi:hypothetical protein
VLLDWELENTWRVSLRVRLTRIRVLVKLDTLKGPVRGLLTYLRGFIEECGDSEKRSMEINYIVDGEAAHADTSTAYHSELFASWMPRVIGAKLIGYVFNIWTEGFCFYSYRITSSS